MEEILTTIHSAGKQKTMITVSTTSDQTKTQKLQTNDSMNFSQTRNQQQCKTENIFKLSHLTQNLLKMSTLIIISLFNRKKWDGRPHSRCPDNSAQDNSARTIRRKI